MAETRSDDQINGSLAANILKSFGFRNIDLPEENNQFQNDKNCAICQIPFGKIGKAHGKKYLCKFCMRGVCGKCSPTKIQHPTSKTEERICFACIEKTIETQIFDEYNSEIFDAASEKKNYSQLLEYKIKETQMEISYNYFTEETINSESKIFSVRYKELRDVLHDLQRSQEGTHQRHKETYENFKKYQKEIGKKNSVIETLQKTLRILKENYYSNKEILSGLRNKEGELQDIEFRIKNQVKEKEKKSIAMSLTLNDKEQKVSEALDGLRHQIHVLEEESSFFVEEIEKTSRENSALDERLVAEGVGTRHKSVDSLIIVVNNKFSLDEEVKIRDLRDRSKENQGIIHNLRVQLEAQNIHMKKSILNTDPTADPGSRHCCRCIIY